MPSEHRLFRPINDQHASDIEQIKRLRQQLRTALEYHNELTTKIWTIQRQLNSSSQPKSKNKLLNEKNKLLNDLEVYDYDNKHDAIIAQIHPLEQRCFGFVITDVLPEGYILSGSYTIDSP